MRASRRSINRTGRAHSTGMKIVKADNIDGQGTYYWRHGIGYEGEWKANKMRRLGDVGIDSIRNFESGKGAH